MSPSRQISYTDERQAIFETTKRLLARAINDGLATAFIKRLSLCSSSSEQYLYVQAPVPSATNCNIWITCALSADADVGVEECRVVGFLRPDYLLPPLLLIDQATGYSAEELDPGPICRFIAQWQPGLSGVDNEAVTATLLRELQDSVDNQQKWLDDAACSLPLGLTSPLIDWERSITCGHPIHPLHRTYLPLPPLDLVPDDLSTQLEPDITFLSVPRHDLTISGPFEATLDPLLHTLDVSSSSSSSHVELDHVVVPCLTTQLPAILGAYPAIMPLKTIHGRTRAHISLGTVSPTPECNFPFYLKFSLNCQITSAIRNLHPPTVLGGPQISSLLSDLLPDNLWVFKHAACVTGALAPAPLHSVDRAQYLACVLRHSLEDQADKHGQALIPAAALYNSPLSSSTMSANPSKQKSKTYAEILFDLGTPEKKRSWLRTYIRTLFSLLLPPLVQYGIGLEAHGQNVLLRVDKATGAIAGFAIRDFDGLRVHGETLYRNTPEKYRHKLNTVGGFGSGSKSRNFVESKEEVWNKVHHALIQLHVSHLVHGLGLEGPGPDRGGWTIVSEELKRVLFHSDEPAGREVYEYLGRETMSVKCFLRMRLKRVSGDHFDRELPNILLRD